MRHQGSQYSFPALVVVVAVLFLTALTIENFFFNPTVAVSKKDLFPIEMSVTKILKQFKAAIIESKEKMVVTSMVMKVPIKDEPTNKAVAVCTQLVFRLHDSGWPYIQCEYNNPDYTLYVDVKYVDNK